MSVYSYGQRLAMPMDTEPVQHTAVSQTGAGVTLNLGSGFREAGKLISFLIVALVFSCSVSIFAIIAAINASKEARLDSYWLERAEVACASRGIILPPPPTIPK